MIIIRRYTILIFLVNVTWVLEVEIIVVKGTPQACIGEALPKAMVKVIAFSAFLVPLEKL